MLLTASAETKKKKLQDMHQQVTCIFWKIYTSYATISSIYHESLVFSTSVYTKKIQLTSGIFHVYHERALHNCFNLYHAMQQRLQILLISVEQNEMIHTNRFLPKVKAK